MKKVTSALALAALVGTPAAAMANVEFGGDYDARYFNTQSSDSRDTGVDQRIRLQSSFESDGGVEVHARLNLMNDRWSGDGSGGNNPVIDPATGTFTADETPFSSRNHRNVELDYGYVSMPTAIGQVNIGRQMANWNPSGLTTTDDRRDRISLVTPLGGGHTAIVASDVRQSVTTADRADDGMLYFGAFLGPLAEDVNYGLLIAQFESSSSGGDAANYGLRGATLVSPYVQGAAGDLSYEVGMHYLGDGRALYSEDTFGAYVKSGFQLTPELLIEGQVFHAADGNLVAGGYDSFSSLINNSPDHDQSATSIAGLNLSGLAAPGTPGTAEQDGMSRTLIAARATYEMMDWTFMGAAGFVNYDDGDAGPRDEDVVFLDAQAHYALTESTTVYGTAGYADAEDYLGRDVFATSVNVNVQF